ncbi:MAG: low-specificity L-threonine aldolase [Candidatus Hydrogenedentota bacterium]
MARFDNTALDQGFVDLRSDTVTRPTAAMRAAMAEAAVGDDVFGEDPNVNALQERAAEMAGKEAALYTPSGSMANLLAVMTQCAPGDTVLLSEDAHVFTFETGSIARIANVMTKTVPGEYGAMTPDAVANRLVLGENDHISKTTLVAMENTTNRGGGAIYPYEAFKGVAEVAREKGLRVHCDGARIFNAVVETGMSAAEYAQHVDTLSFCFSKGLGAPIGSVLTGDSATIRRARRFRKMLGGGMRQAGVAASAALYALEHHVERLREDHQRARRFREALADTPGLSFPMPSPTNMVYVRVPDTQALIARLREQGVLVMAPVAHTIRVVFHLDVDDAGLERAIDAFKTAGAELAA